MPCRGARGGAEGHFTGYFTRWHQLLPLCPNRVPPPEPLSCLPSPPAYPHGTAAAVPPSRCVPSLSPLPSLLCVQPRTGTARTGSLTVGSLVVLGEGLLLLRVGLRYQDKTAWLGTGTACLQRPRWGGWQRLWGQQCHPELAAPRGLAVSPAPASSAPPFCRGSCCLGTHGTTTAHPSSPPA